MKLKDLRRHFYDHNIDEIEINPALAALQQEFSIKLNSKKDFRERAVEILKRANVRFTTEWNLLWFLGKKLITCKCLYCGSDMDHISHAIGTSTHYTFNFVCPKCSSHMFLKLEVDAMEFDPPRIEK